MKVESRQFDISGTSYVLLIAETDTEVDALHELGRVGSIVTAEFLLAEGTDQLYLRAPFATNPAEDFADVFIGNEATHEVHHKNVIRAACNLADIEAPVVFESLLRARTQGYDLCGHCFRSEE